MRLSSIIIKDGESTVVHTLGTLSTPRYTFSQSTESRRSVKSTRRLIIVGTVRTASATNKILTEYGARLPE